ncbi:hypothetical protein LTR17_025712 [Elasticomyces elasticus]|nr:hypothetical protein LTR17_025712 [Elasticomyces elasticus]
MVNVMVLPMLTAVASAGLLPRLEQCGKYCTNFAIGQKDTGKQVCAYPSGSNMIVDYPVVSGYKYNEAHVYLGTSPPGTSAPGQFPYTSNNGNCKLVWAGSSVTCTIPISSFGKCGGSYYIATHSASNTETGWGNGPCIKSSSNSWAMYWGPVTLDCTCTATSTSTYQSSTSTKSTSTASPTSNFTYQSSTSAKSTSTASPTSTSTYQTSTSTKSTSTASPTSTSTYQTSTSTKSMSTTSTKAKLIKVLVLSLHKFLDLRTRRDYGTIVSSFTGYTSSYTTTVITNSYPYTSGYTSTYTTPGYCTYHSTPAPAFTLPRALFRW